MDKTISFTMNTHSVVTSNRILYTPSSFARSALLTLQEIGTLQALKPHTSRRDNLQSYLFFYVVSGTGKLVYQGKEYELNEGDCVFVDCQLPYAHSTDTDLWTLSWIHFHGHAMQNIYEKYLERGGRPVFRPDDLTPFQLLHKNLYNIASSDDYIRDMRINGELNNLLTLLMKESWHPEEQVYHDLKRQNVVSVKLYLEEHYDEKITLDYLTEHFYISKYYLTRVFKEQFGTSISHYLLSIRITKAKQMLRFTDEKVENIGYKCGLGAPHYFSRTFKKVEGMSPSEYREKW